MRQRVLRGSSCQYFASISSFLGEHHCADSERSPLAEEFSSVLG